MPGMEKYMINVGSDDDLFFLAWGGGGDDDDSFCLFV